MARRFASSADGDRVVRPSAAKTWQEGVSGFGLDAEAALMELLGQDGGSIGVALRSHGRRSRRRCGRPLAVLNRTEDVCQALADSRSEGYGVLWLPCRGYGLCVQTVRDLLIESLSKGGGSCMAC